MTATRVPRVSHLSCWRWSGVLRAAGAEEEEGGGGDVVERHVGHGGLVEAMLEGLGGGPEQ